MASRERRPPPVAGDREEPRTQPGPPSADDAAVELLTTAEEAAIQLLATARQVAAARLTSVHRFEAMFRDHDSVMLLIDPATRQIMDANPAAAAFYGYGVDALRSMLITQINMMPSADVADLMAQAESRTNAHFVFPHRLASGEIRRVDVHTSPIGDGQPLLFSIVVDIEDRARAEEELARASGYARSLIEASLDPLVTISSGGLITDVNAATETVTGVPRQALIGSDFASYFTDPEQARAGYQESFTAGSVTDYPLSIRHVNGSIAHVLYNATVYRDPDGEVAGVFAAARDVTQRKRAEEALAESENLYRLLSENADGAVLLVSPSGTLIWASPSIERLLGFTPAEVMALDGEALVHPDDLNAARTTVARGEAPAEPTSLRFRRKDGQYRWMAATSRPVTDPDGNLTSRIDSLRDIHEEVLAREALAASEGLLRAVLDSSGDTAIRVGLDGRIEFVNQRAVEISGIPAEEWIGSTFEEMGYPAELAQSWDVQRRHVFSTGQRVTFEFEIDNADGHRWYETTVAPEITVDGTVAHVIETSRDITDRKETEAALRSSQAQLEQAQRIAHIGSWTLDNATKHVTWTQELYLMQGLDPASPVPDYTEHSRLFTPASWRELSAALAITQETGVPYELDLEMVRPDGSHGWMLARGEAVHDAQGAIVGLVGVALDVLSIEVGNNGRVGP